VKILDCIQGSPAWHRAKLGKPSASNFDRILTPSTRKPSTQQAGYMHALLAEWLTGVPHGADTSSAFMERGRLLEPQARSWYEYEKGVTVRQVGLVQRDDGMVACSPDGLVGDDTGVEIKCPSAATHVRVLLDGLDDYWCQVQGSLWLTERAHWDLVSYSPDMPSVVARIERDEEFIAALAAEVDVFIAKLMQARERLLARGCTPSGLQLTAATAGTEDPF
jgi:hypothetical protein